MPQNAEFFEHKNSQAVLKHGVLTRYAYYFAVRAGTGRRVAFIDGYAGEGRYKDGSPGSPLLLASEAERAQLMRRRVKLAFVESDNARRELLQRSLEDHQISADWLSGSRLEDDIDGLLRRYQQHAVFLFVDPFGLATKRTTLERVLERSSSRQPIDVLYHFSLSAVARMGRAALLDSPAGREDAAQLDAALGSVDWRPDFERADRPLEPTLAAMEVARRFGDAVTRQTEVKSLAIPVRQRPDQLPKYLLILFSRDERATWDFADFASRAHTEWLHHCSTEDYDAHVRRDESSGVQQLISVEAPVREDVEAELKLEAEPYLRRHLSDLLMRRGSVRAVDAIEDVYGDMLGRARVTHLRAAIKALHDAGQVDDNGETTFWLRPVRWTGNLE